MINFRLIVLVLITALLLKPGGSLASLEILWLVLSAIMLSVLIGGAMRVPEARSVLLGGWQQFLEATEAEGQMELASLARACRLLVLALFGFSLAYWAGVSGIVDARLGLAGAVIYLVELVLNMELLEYLVSSPGARLSADATTRVLAGYYVLAATEFALLGITVALLLMG